MLEDKKNSEQYALKIESVQQKSNRNKSQLLFYATENL